MSIKQNGGVFGRNPTFNNVTVDGQLTQDGSSGSSGAVTKNPLTWQAVNEGVLADGNRTYNNANGTYGHVWTYAQVGREIVHYEIDFSSYNSNNDWTVGVIDGPSTASGSSTSIPAPQKHAKFQYSNGYSFGHSGTDPTAGATGWPAGIGQQVKTVKTTIVINTTAQTAQILLNGVDSGTIDISTFADPRVFATSGTNGYTGTIVLYAVDTNELADSKLDGQYYLRKDGAWVPTTVVDEPPVTGSQYGRSNGGWEPLWVKNPLTWQAVNEGALENGNLTYNNGNGTNGHAWTYAGGSREIVAYEVDFSSYNAVNAFDVGVVDGPSTGTGTSYSPSTTKPFAKFTYTNGNLTGSSGFNPSSNGWPSNGVIGALSKTVKSTIVLNYTAKTAQLLLDGVDKGTLDISTFADPRVYVSSGTNGYTGTVVISGVDNGELIEAPIDSQHYVRKDGTWQASPITAPEPLADGKTYGRNNGNWVPVTAPNPLTWQAVNEGVLENGNLTYNNGNGTNGHAWTYSGGSREIVAYEVDFSSYNAVNAFDVGVVDGPSTGTGTSYSPSTTKPFAKFTYTNGNLTGSSGFNPSSNGWPSNGVIGALSKTVKSTIVLNYTAKTAQLLLDGVDKGTLDISTFADPRVYIDTGGNGYTGTVVISGVDTSTTTAPNLEVSGALTLTAIPTSLPSTAGIVWSDSGTLKISS